MFGNHYKSKPSSNYMFNLLKEKLKSWASNFSKKVSQKSETPAKAKEKPKKQTLKQEKKTKEKSFLRKKQEIIEHIPSSISENKTKKLIVEEQEEPEEVIEGFFKRIVSKITKVKISEKEFETYAEELEMLLLENNVALEVAEKIIKELKARIIRKEFLKKEIEGIINDTFKDIIYEILINPFDIVEKIQLRENRKKPYVILFAGINGTGKTTTIAKIAELLKKKHISCVLAAADTFRAASIEQLKKHGEKLGIKTISHEYESDPAAVGFDAIKYAEKNNIDCVLIDTAGRMHTAKNLMTQIEKISRVCNPNLKIYIGESTTGNDAIEQIRGFNSAIGIDGIILTKADIDEKGGTALSVGYIIKKPILYLGTGQEYSAIEPFDRNKFIEKLGLN